ncbi:MAG: type II and III secretion system protein family protein [Alphaproteobacteria bacterium]
MKYSMWRLAQVGLVFGLLLGSPEGPAAAAVQAIGSGEDVVELEVQRGKLLRLSAPASAVFIADPEIADITVKSPTLVYVTAKRAGETSLFAVDQNERVLADVRIVTTHNLEALDAALRKMLPRAVIGTSSVAGGLLLSGAVQTATEAEQAQRIAAEFVAGEEVIINQLALIGPNQVNLRVRVAEVSRDVSKRFGFNFDLIPSIGSVTLGLATGRVPVIDGVAQTRFDNQNSIFATSRDVNAVVDAMSEEGLITVLAEPNLTALSGETANFLAGGEFPAIVPTDSGGLSLQYKSFGISLSFTPTVLDSGRISLKVAPEVSALSEAGAILFQNFSIPALTTRRASTTVELGSGQSLAIAGLLQNKTQQTFDEFPGLADIPVLGALFRSSEFKRDESELVIIVTPYLVRPVSVMAMATPTDGFVPASDFDRIVNGRAYVPQQPSSQQIPRGPGAEGLAGPVGFVLN